jgi:hypothetical protein
MSSPASFSSNIPNKIGSGIKVSGANTLMKKKNASLQWCAAIADEPINAKTDGTKYFCLRIDNHGDYSFLMFGFTPMETFDSNKAAYFGFPNATQGFRGYGLNLHWARIEPGKKGLTIISETIARKAKEIIVILDVSNNGTKKVLRFICDGIETKSTDVSKKLKGNRLYPSVCLRDENEQVTTISIDRIKKRTPAVEKLIREGNSSGDVVGVEVASKTAKSKAKQVAKKKTKKETKPKMTKATKKTEKNKTEKKPKAKK